MPFTVDTENLHPTTEACLAALQRLQGMAEFSNILEVGSGNGILSAVAAHAWDARVLAVDISPQAVEDTRRTAAQYEVEHCLTALRSDGFSEPEIARRAPYDLIVCNLLAELLVRLAPDLRKCLSPGGFALLSGSLAWQADMVEITYKNLGFEIVDKMADSPWVTWILRHTAETLKNPGVIKA